VGKNKELKRVPDANIHGRTKYKNGYDNLEIV
jgi:hypothetical protein